MNGETIIQMAIAKRAQQGLRLTWIVDQRTAETFTTYPVDATQKVAWLASGERNGWELIDDASWHKAA